MLLPRYVWVASLTLVLTGSCGTQVWCGVVKCDVAADGGVGPDVLVTVYLGLVREVCACVQWRVGDQVGGGERVCVWVCA